MHCAHFHFEHVIHYNLRNKINMRLVLRLRRNTHWQVTIPVLTAYFPVLAYGILGKGELILEDCLSGITGSFTQAGTGCTDLQLMGSSVAA